VRFAYMGFFLPLRISKTHLRPSTSTMTSNIYNARNWNEARRRSAEKTRVYIVT